MLGLKKGEIQDAVDTQNIMPGTKKKTNISEVHCGFYCWKGVVPVIFAIWTHVIHLPSIICFPWIAALLAEGYPTAAAGAKVRIKMNGARRRNQQQEAWYYVKHFSYENEETLPR